MQIITYREGVVALMAHHQSPYGFNGSSAVVFSFRHSVAVTPYKGLLLGANRKSNGSHEGQDEQTVLHDVAFRGIYCTCLTADCWFALPSGKE